MPKTRSITIDTSEIDEMKRQLQVIESIRKIIKDTVFKVRDEHLIRCGKPTLHAGDLVLRPRIVGNLKVCRLALRALGLDVAHDILEKGIE